METYWLSFRIDNDATYEERYKRLIEAVKGMVRTKWWLETTSFIVFRSDKSIDAVAQAVKSAFNPNKDIALIGMPDYKSARLVGASTDQDIYDLIPFVKKV